MNQPDLSSLDEYLKSCASAIEAALDRFLPPPSQHPAVIHEAMRYSVLGGGKRIRPVLTLAVCEMFGGRKDDALIPACAVELVHAYSLVHDDLPCLDNDELRRGQPTCHKKYGEAIALLTGDALLTFAFQLIGELNDKGKAHRILSELSHAAGTAGMVGGQVMDVFLNERDIDMPTLDSIHIYKTGQLIKTSCLLGAIAASAAPEQEARILKFGEYLGFTFQIVDDILDGDGYLRFMSAHEAREKARDLVEKAKEEISVFPKRERLLQIAELILARDKE